MTTKRPMPMDQPVTVPESASHIVAIAGGAHNLALEGVRWKVLRNRSSGPLFTNKFLLGGTNNLNSPFPFFFVDMATC